MKLIAVICVFLVASATAIPLYRNETVGEEFVEDNTEDWQLIPDEDGNLHLVDIHAVNMDLEPQFVAGDIIFRLFAPPVAGTAQIIQLNNNAQLTASRYNPALQTRFHIHGWNGGGAGTGTPIRTAFHAQIQCNVFTVDWGVGAQTPNYIAARNRVNLVGQTVANFINWIVSTRQQSPAAISIVGHSLGAHCAGAAGKRTNTNIGSIVGLDPAGPLFNIVTDAGNLGFAQPIGDSNFYPNWGVNQPGCAGSACSHSRVNDFYQLSINHGHNFGATRCQNYQNIVNRNCISSGASRRMGGHTPPIDGTAPPETVFFLTTGATSPFAHGPR